MNDNKVKDILKGIAAAALISVCFFAFGHRLPEMSDAKGLVALFAVCVAGSAGGLMTDTFKEDMLSSEMTEESIV